MSDSATAAHVRHPAEPPRLVDFDWRQPRPAAIVMRPERMGACFPGALSFAHTLFDKFAARPWALERQRIDLDAEGRGEVLYRLSDGRTVLHFMVMSNSYSSDSKADRSYNMNWDATAALCEGEWSPEREDFLRREIPKQRFGRLDHQTLAYTRGNRSGRVFDHVVESLAAGRQPDSTLLTPIGYIFRTTGFTANGFIGMRSYLGMEDDHLLAGPYHAQMCSAFLLREYVSDLVDAMAAARNPAAAKLSPAMRRYLGIGNSAGLGLTQFICNHPRMVHLWTRKREEALAEIRRQTVTGGDPALRHFHELVARAQRFFREDPRDGNDVFLPYGVISQQMGEVLAWLDTTGAPSDLWLQVAAWAEANLHFETIEALNVIFLELYPAITRSHSHGLTVDEDLDCDPAASIGDLRALIDRDYAWMQTLFATIAQEAPRFWYMSTEAPYEPRRGYRGPLPEYEFESHMDAPLRFGQLQAALADTPDDESLAAFLLARPDLRNIVNRLWTLRDEDYANIRESSLSNGHETFDSTRFMLSHYGMDKLDAIRPRSVRGVLLQGAPIGEDLAAQRPGSWPFPLAPDQQDGRIATEAHREGRENRARDLAKLEVWKETSFGDHVVIAPVEMIRWTQRSLQVAGAQLGHALRGADLLHLREILFGDGMRMALDCSADGAIGRGAASATDLGPAVTRLDVAPGESPVFVLPSLLDMACRNAHGAGQGVALVSGLSQPGLADVLPVWAARRGYDCTVIARAGAGWRVVMPTGADLAIAEYATLAETGLGLPPAAGQADLILLCQPRDTARPPRDPAPGADRIDVAGRIAQAYRHGLVVNLAELETLRDIAFRTLVPTEREAPIATE